MTVGIDPASGRIRTMTFPGRVAHAYTGIRTLRLDNYRDVAGLVLPHKVNGRFDGKPDPEWTWTVTSIRLNEPIDPALFKGR